MKLTWHIVRTDLRRRRWLLAGWLAALVIGAIAEGLHFGLRFAANVDSDWLEFLGFLGGSGTVIAWALTLILAAEFILGDSLTKPTAFWKPRPISGARLLAVKACELGILVVVPVCFYLVLLAWHGAVVRELALAAAGALLWRAVVVLGAAAIAASSPGLGGFAIRALAVLFVARFLSTIVTAMVSVPSMMGNVPPPSDSLVASGVLAAKIVAVLLGAALLIIPYLVTHVRRLSVGLYAAAFVVMVVPAVWSWDLLGKKTRPNDESIQPEFSVQALRVKSGVTASRRPIISGLVLPVALQNEQIAVPRGVRSASVSGEAGVEKALTPIPLTVGQLLRVDAVAAMDPEALQRSLGNVTLLNPPSKTGVDLTFFSVREKNGDRPTNASVRVRAEIDAERCRYVSEAEMPVVNGAKARTGEGSVRVVNVSPRLGAVWIAIEQQEFRSDLTGASTKSLLFSSLMLSGRMLGTKRDRVVYVLVNRGRGEAVLASQKNSDGRPESLGELSRGRRSLVFDSNQIGAPALEWLHGATLVRVRLVELGAITGVLNSEGVNLSL